LKGWYGTEISAAVTCKSYKKAPRTSAQKIRTPFYVGLWIAENTKTTANGVGDAGALERLEGTIEADAMVLNNSYGSATA
jgi:hypothetical protein